MVTIRNATFQNVEQALGNTSQKFDSNVIFNRMEQKGKNFFVTLRVVDSHKVGSRRGYSGKRMVQACWHVYGVFFDELISSNDKIVIVAMGKKIQKGEGNWEDTNVGSLANPRMYSEMCDCERDERFIHSNENSEDGA